MIGTVMWHKYAGLDISIYSGEIRNGIVLILWRFSEKFGSLGSACEKILIKLPNQSSIAINFHKGFIRFLSNLTSIWIVYIFKKKKKLY